MDLGIAEKKALVLGGSAGIGRGIAAALTAEQASVCIAARNLDRLEQTRKEIAAAHCLQVDLMERSAGNTVVPAAIERMHGLDILVVNTGGPPKGEFMAVEDADWEAQFQNLLLSTIQLFRSAFTHMRAQGWGRILVVGSVAAREPIDGLTISNVFRAGILGLVNTTSREFAAAGVTVNAILPGYIATERLREVRGTTAGLESGVPVGRIGTPQEVGQLAAFLCSQHAGYLTGQAICIDGGFSRGI